MQTQQSVSKEMTAQDVENDERFVQTYLIANCQIVQLKRVVLTFFKI